MYITVHCVDFVVSAPLSLSGSESGTIYLYLGAGPTVVVSSEYTQVNIQCSNGTHAQSPYLLTSGNCWQGIEWLSISSFLWEFTKQWE